MPSPEDYAHAFRIKEHLRFLDEERDRIAKIQDALDQSFNAVQIKRISLLSELDALKG